MTEKEEQKIGAYVTKSNPPNLGVLLEVIAAHKQYDRILVVYYGGDGMFSSQDWINEVGAVLHTLTDSIKVLSYEYDFDSIKNMPKFLKEKGVTSIITSSNTILMQCALNKVECVRVRKAPYYYDSFQQLAIAKGMILTNLRKKFGTK